MDMLAIDREAARQRKRAMFIESLLLWIIGLAWLSIALGILLFLMMTHAAANSICLTKKEARHLWPKSHLYWYSKDHCWSNRRGPPRNLKFDPIFSKAHAESTAPPDKNPVVKDADEAGRDVDPPTRRVAAPTNEKKAEPKPARPVVKIVKADDYNELDAAADVDMFFNAKPFTYQAYVIDLEKYRATNWYKHIWDPK